MVGMPDREVSYRLVFSNPERGQMSCLQDTDLRPVTEERIGVCTWALGLCIRACTLARLCSVRVCALLSVPLWLGWGWWSGRGVLPLCCLIRVTQGCSSGCYRAQRSDSPKPEAASILMRGCLFHVAQHLLNSVWRTVYLCPSPMGGPTEQRHIYFIILRGFFSSRFLNMAKRIV